MTSTISAITTGGGGIVMSGDSSGNLSLLSGATTVVAVTASGATVTGTLAVSGGVTLTTTLPVLQGGTGVTTSTGTGAGVHAATPVFTTTIGVGAATPAASGSGITFPATQSASSDANTLDDYEEGTWTPTLVSTGATFAYTIQQGTYTKIGRQVTCLIRLQVSASGTVTNPTTIGGLPFTISAVPAGGGFVTFNNMTVQPNINSIASTTTAELNAQLTAADLSPTGLGINGVSKYLSCVIIYQI